MEHERDNISKLAATQNIIRNKFKKTYSDRLVHEHNVIRALKPLTTTSSKVTTKKYALKTSSLGKVNIDDLCARLKTLIKSSLKCSDNCNEEIKSILDKLREHGIIV